MLEHPLGLWHPCSTPGSASLVHGSKHRTQQGAFQEMEACPVVPILSQGHLCEPWSAVQVRQKTRGPPGASKFITNKCNLSYSCTPRKACSRSTEFVLVRQCQKGRTHHCLYTCNFHILHCELKTTLPDPIFATYFVSKMYICYQHCLDRKGYDYFSWGLSIQESEISSFSNFLLA